jgi:hypothetical protein
MDERRRKMNFVDIVGRMTGWLLLVLFILSDYTSGMQFAISFLMNLVKVLGSLAAVVNAVWLIVKWYKEREETIQQKRMDLFRRIVLRYMEIRYFIGQISGRSTEADIDDDNVFIRINYLLNNQVRKMIMVFSCNALSEYEIINLFDQDIYQLCEQFENKCNELVNESKDDGIVDFRISILNVKSKAYAACNTFDELILRCTGIIGGDKSRIDALIRDVANEVF